ncbi:MAG TPA: hypothetical protein VFF73_25010 [Planctomycetota bacterium]|nr:hypothetical protein [Planctomycetota bacterium]
MDGQASPRIAVATDLSILCAYDPKGMKDFVRKSRAWVYEVKDNDYGKLDPVKTGKIAVWPLGGKGGRYELKLLQGSYPEAWKPFEKGHVAGMGVVVEDERLFVGPGERIPGDGFGDRIVDIEDGGKLLPFPNGRFELSVHVFDWKHEDKFFTPDGDPTADAPPDIAVVATAKEGDFAPPRPCPPLLDFLPKPKAPPAPAVMPRLARSVYTQARPEVARAPRTRTRREDADWHPSPDPLPPPKPGEIRIGMRVRHAQFGEGTVLFIREGFPKVKVDFRGHEEKVDRSELSVI